MIQLKHDHKRALRWRLWKVRVAVASYFPGPISRFIDPSIPIENDSFAHALSNRLSKLLCCCTEEAEAERASSTFSLDSSNQTKTEINCPCPSDFLRLHSPHRQLWAGWLGCLPSYLPIIKSNDSNYLHFHRQ